MSVHLRIENSGDGLVATISQRNDAGKVTGQPSTAIVQSKDEAKRKAKELARSLGLKTYGVVDKTNAAVASDPSLS